MNKFYEYFLKAFIDKRYRDRFSNNDSGLLSKLCHNHNDVIINKFLVVSSDLLFNKLIKSHLENKVYCITYNDKFNDKIIDQVDMFDIDSGFPVIYVFPNGIAKFKTESDNVAEVFILDRPDKNIILQSVKHIEV